MLPNVTHGSPEIVVAKLGTSLRYYVVLGQMIIMSILINE